MVGQIERDLNESEDEDYEFEDQEHELPHRDQFQKKKYSMQGHPEQVGHPNQ